MNKFPLGVWEDPLKDITTFVMWSRFKRSKLQLEYKGGKDARGPWDEKATS